MVKLDRIKVCFNLETYQRQTRKWRDEKVKLWEIAVGDLLIKRKPNVDNLGKLVEKWEGPFIVTKQTRPGAFYITKQDGEELPHSWNVDSLKKYYP